MIGMLDPLGVRCFGRGSMLLRRLVIALAGLLVRRATGLSSASRGGSAIWTRREDDGVPVDREDEPGVV